VAGAEKGEGVVGAAYDAAALLEGVLQQAPPKELRALLKWEFSGRGLYLYAR
jgi:hypothetical protein